MMTSRYAKPENMAKVAATKDAEGHVSIPDRMQRASFEALARAGWLKKVEIPAPAGHWRATLTRHVITPEGEKAIERAVIAEANPFEGGHGAKAQETFRLLGTKHSDWFHPAVKWVRETRNMPHDIMKACPTCDGLRWVRKDAEGNVVPPPARPAKGSYDSARDDYERAARNEEHKRAGFAVHGGNCPTCKVYRRRFGSSYSECSGQVFSHVEWKPVEMMVGYIVWPKGVKHGVSRFTDRNIRSHTQCEICGKGINKSMRVPVAHDKDGKVFSMLVGQDCARKFTKVATIAKPSKDENKKGLPSVLDVNYVVEGEEAK